MYEMTVSHITAPLLIIYVFSMLTVSGIQFTFYFIGNVNLLASVFSFPWCGATEQYEG